MIHSYTAIPPFLAFIAATIAQVLLIRVQRKSDIESIPPLAKILLGVGVAVTLYYSIVYGYVMLFGGSVIISTVFLRLATIFLALLIAVEGGYMLAFFRANAEQQRLMNERLDFISRASHELRTPLSKVFSSLELIVTYWNDDRQDQKYLVDIAYRGAAALRSLIENMSILEGNGRAYSDMHLSAVVGSVCTEYTTLAAHVGIVMNCETEPGITFHGDETGLRAAVAALVDNAIKFGDTVVTLSLTEANGEIVITVTDDGIGIPLLFHRIIFDWGYQVDGTATREYGGLGIGLSVARQVVEKNNGSLTVASEPGDGSVFTIRLPVPALSK